MKPRQPTLAAGAEAAGIFDPRFCIHFVFIIFEDEPDVDLLNN